MTDETSLDPIDPGVAALANRVLNAKENPDIYPLGQGHGLVADLLNFGLNNLYRYGQRSGQFNDRVASALQDIQAGGHPDLSPLVSDIISTNPASAGVLGPIRTQAQKQVVKAMWRADPEVVKAIQTDPRVLNINVPGSGYGDPLRAAKMAYMWGEMPEGAAATYNASRGIRVGPATLRGAAFDPAKVIMPPAYSPWANPIRTVDQLVTQKGGMTSLPEAAAHEGHHFLNEPRIYGEGGPTNEEALAMYDRLSPYLARHAQKAALEGGKLNADPRVALDEALAYLSQASARAPGKEGSGTLLHELLKMKPGPEQGTTAGVRLAPDVIGSAVGKAEALDKASLGGMIQDLIRRVAGGGGRMPDLTREARFRDLGIARERGQLTAQEFADKLAAEPNYPRYKELVQNVVRRKVGNEFPAYRGNAITDPLFSGELPSATSVSLDRGVARDFADTAAQGGERGRLARLDLTPEAVLGIMPRRGLYPTNPEISIDPRAAKSIQNVMDYVPYSEQMTRPIPPLGQGPGTRSVTFNKFSAGETKGSDVLNQIYNEMQRKEGKSGVWLSRGADTSVPLSRDEFMKSILKDVAEAAMPSSNFPEYTNVAQGLTQLRRNLGPGGGIRISPQDTAAVMQHLDRSGMLEKKVLEDALSKFRDSREVVDSSILARMKRFAEESGRGK